MAAQQPARTSPELRARLHSARANVGITPRPGALPPSPSQTSTRCSKRRAISMPSGSAPIVFFRAGLRICSSALWAVRPTMCDAPAATSNIRLRPGTNPVVSSPRWNGIRVNCSRGLVLSLPICQWRQTGSSGSTISVAPLSSTSKREKAGNQLDAPLMQGHGAERGPPSASRTGLQSRCLPARH